MIFERIESEGLAHFSYLIGDGNDAIVIDPRRDCDVYVEKALQAGLAITHVLETHRHEDFVTGSIELADRTGAEIWHSDSQWSYEFGREVKDGQSWVIGQLNLSAMHTPGHTPGSMSYLLRDPSGASWAIFTGDVLFAGEVGRVDLLGAEKVPEMAGLLHDTLFNKLLPLGDEVIVCPAHGQGSACGSSISGRSWTTIGLERRLNPRLQFRDREGFINNIDWRMELPPYFARMEVLNIEGPPPLAEAPAPRPLTASQLAERLRDAFVLDTRMELGFNAAHIPGALSVWRGGLSRYGGWFLPYDVPIILVSEEGNSSRDARVMTRMGYDNLEGFLTGGMLAWHTSGFESSAIKMVTVQELCHRLDAHEVTWILDVRGIDEINQVGKIPGAHHIHVTQLSWHLDRIPRDKQIYIFCGSGMRSTIAASYLQKQGWRQLVVVLGGAAGWRSTTCPLEPVAEKVG